MEGGSKKACVREGKRVDLGAKKGKLEHARKRKVEEVWHAKES